MQNDTLSQQKQEIGEIIIPNSHVTLSFGSLISFPMKLRKFKDYLAGFSKNKIEQYSNPENTVAYILKPQCIFHEYKELENGFCYAEFLEKSRNYNFYSVIIVYLSNNGEFKKYIPIAGNAVNRLSHDVIQGTDIDKFWLWEELHWGEKRPHGPISVDESLFNKICISFEKIEKEIAQMASVVPKNSVPEEKLKQLDKGVSIIKGQI